MILNETGSSACFNELIFALWKARLKNFSSLSNMKIKHKKGEFYVYYKQKYEFI